MKNLIKIFFLLFSLSAFAQTGTSFVGKIGVNVGTTTPTERMKVNGSATITGALKFQNYGTGVLKTNSIGDVSSGAIVNNDISSSAAINASKISTGLISNTEYDNLNGIRGNIQTQIDSTNIKFLSTNNKKMTTIFGIVRQVSKNSGWYILNDDTHTPSITSCSVNGNGDLVVNYGFTANKVGTFLINNDEYYSQFGINIGSSVGLSSSTISASGNCDIEVNFDADSLTSVDAFHDSSVTYTNNANGTATFTFPTTGSSKSAVTIDEIANTTKYKNRKNVIHTRTATSVIIQQMVLFSGYISYNGTSWEVITKALTKPTFSFSGGYLTVNHTNTTNSMPVVTMRNSATINAQLDGYSDTLFVVAFRDLLGNLITTPSTGMRVYFQIQDFVRAEDLIGNLQIHVPHSKINFNNLFGEFGNFWIKGEMIID